MRSVELFAGAGGMALGLHRAGFRHLLFAESDPYCRAVLAERFPGVPCAEDVRQVAHPHLDGRRGPVVGGGQDERGDGRAADRVAGAHAGDVRDVAHVRLGEHEGPRRAEHRGDGYVPHPAHTLGAVGRVDLLSGGFPCQDVSVAGRRAGLAGERSGLWWEFLRVADLVRPRALLVENVEGLLSSNGGRDLAAIVDALADRGYGVAWRVLDAQHFGVPQRRRRVFLLALPGDRAGADRAAQVLALREGGGGDPPPRGEARPGTSGGIADGSPVARPLTAGTGQRFDYETDDLIVSATGTIAHALRACGHDGSEDGTGRGTPIVVSALGTTRGGGHGLNAEKAAGGQIVPVAFHQTQDPISGTDASPALGRTSIGMGVMAHGVRRLTPVECERLMGWPDGWTDVEFRGKPAADSRRYAACGNGVVAPVAEWIGRRLMAALKEAS